MAIKETGLININIFPSNKYPINTIKHIFSTAVY